MGHMTFILHNVSFVWFAFLCRRLPHVSLEESPREAKPSHSLDLSDTDTETECGITVPVGAAVRTFYLQKLHVYFHTLYTVPQHDVMTYLMHFLPLSLSPSHSQLGGESPP